MELNVKDYKEGWLDSSDGSRYLYVDEIHSAITKPVVLVGGQGFSMIDRAHYRITGRMPVKSQAQLKLVKG